jgi:hypothetical protein
MPSRNRFLVPVTLKEFLTARRNDPHSKFHSQHHEANDTFLRSRTSQGYFLRTAAAIVANAHRRRARSRSRGLENYADRAAGPGSDTGPTGIGLSEVPSIYANDGDSSEVQRRSTYIL